MGAGVATHYFAPTPGFQPEVKAFWTSVASIMSGYVTIAIPNEGEEFDETTGILTGTWTQGTSSSVTGGGSGAYAGGVGACVAWDTSGIHAGRKVRGRTFIVPLAANTYDADGTLASGTRTTLNTAAATLLAATSASFYIWTRPRTGLAGAVHAVTSGNVADHVSWLRSRR